MSGIRRTISSIKSLNGKLSGNHFENAVTELREAENGLSNDDIKSLLSLITDDKLRNCNATGFKDLLFCCIPESSISSDVIDIPLLWMLYEFDNDYVAPTKINAVLEWVSGLLESNLLDKNHIDGYYEMYYRLLEREPCQRLACKLIHMLTRPEDVYRGRVEAISTLYKKGGGKAKHIAHLLELFKTFKPELVPENVKSYSREAAFKILPPGLQRSLDAALQRVESQNNRLSAETAGLDWTAVMSKKNKTGMPLIPSAMYVHLGSELYREKRHKVVEFLDKVSLATYHLSCEIPTSILSLLLNEGGIHFLATHNSDVHARFSSVLYSCLHSVFIMNNRNVPYEEREHFLKQLVVLEDYMQQGIPVVSRFLAFYIASWNGEDHKNLIYRLLERITLANFAEFNDVLLTHLQTLFLSGDVEDKVLIVNTLAELVYNMYGHWANKLPKEQLFLGEKYEWETDFKSTVPQLIEVVTHLCELGLQLSSNDPHMLHTSLCFYETLVELQTEAKLEITIIPPTIFYRCLFSLDFNSLARACSLLLRYNNLGPSGSYGNHNVARLNKYSCDVWNCLVNKKAFTKSMQGHILQKHDRLKQILTVDPDSALSVEYHPAMLGLAQHLQSLSLSSDVVLSYEELKNYIMLHFPELSNCIHALSEKYNEFHSM